MSISPCSRLPAGRGSSDRHRIAGLQAETRVLAKRSAVAGCPHGRCTSPFRGEGHALVVRFYAGSRVSPYGYAPVGNHKPVAKRDDSSGNACRAAPASHPPSPLPWLSSSSRYRGPIVGRKTDTRVGHRRANVTCARRGSVGSRSLPRLCRHVDRHRSLRPAVIARHVGISASSEFRATTGAPKKTRRRYL